MKNCRVLFLSVLSILFLASSSFAVGGAELAEKVSAKRGITKAQAKTEIDAVFTAIKDEMTTGEKVTIQNFGTFYLQNRGPRQARNPRTGEAIQVGARRYPRFRSSDNLKKLLNTQQAVSVAQNEVKQDVKAATEVAAVEEVK